MSALPSGARARAGYILVVAVVGAGCLAKAAGGQRGNPVPPDQRGVFAVPRTPGTSTSTPSNGKPILQAADLTYLGAIRMPDNGVDTRYAYGGLTGRIVNGRVHLFLYGNNVGLPRDQLYEIEDPGTGYSTDYRFAPRATLVTTWGDIYHGRRHSYDGSQPLDLQYLLPDGLYWNESTHLLYWTYYDGYNVTGRPDWGLGATSLDDPATGHSTAYGPWRTVASDGDGHKYYGPHRCRYLFTNPLDGTMMCGSSLASGSQNSPWGPDAYGGAPWPTAATPAGPSAPDIALAKRYLEYYFMGNTNTSSYVDGQGAVHGPLRAFRRRAELPVWEDPSIGTQILRANPATNNGVSSWSELDSTAGAVWLELTSKHGLLFASTLVGSPDQNPLNCTSAAHEWYSNAGLHPPIGACSHGCAPPVAITGPVTTAAFPALIVFDPDQLQLVSNGVLTDYMTEPSAVIDLQQTFAIRTAGVDVVGAGRAIRGMYFDPNQKRLYLIAPQADDTRAGNQYLEALIHVFQVKD